MLFSAIAPVLPLDASPTTYNVRKTVVCSGCGDEVNKVLIQVSKEWFDEMMRINPDQFYITGPVNQKHAHWDAKFEICNCGE